MAGHVVHADVMTDAATGRSKGCGLVQFASARDASNAISTLHDTELNGRKMFVREDRESGGATATRLGEGFGGGGAAAAAGGCSVYVGNLSWDVAWQGERLRPRTRRS